MKLIFSSSAGIDDTDSDEDFGESGEVSAGRPTPSAMRPAGRRRWCGKNTVVIRLLLEQMMKYFFKEFILNKTEMSRNTYSVDKINGRVAIWIFVKSYRFFFYKCVWKQTLSYRQVGAIRGDRLESKVGGRLIKASGRGWLHCCARETASSAAASSSPTNTSLPPPTALTGTSNRMIFFPNRPKNTLA